MCIFPKAPDSPEPPAAAPALPAKSPDPQEIAGGRKADNEALYGTPTGPKLRRPNTTGTVLPGGGAAGVRM